MTEKEVKQFYNSKEWKEKRVKILIRDHYECQDCRARIAEANKQEIVLSASERIIRAAEQVHHIKELREYSDLRLKDDNLISLCIPCHNIRHGREPKRFVRRKPIVSTEKW